MSAKKENKPTFEQSLRRLEQIVDELEQGTVPLDEALKMYEEGLELSKTCVARLSQAEMRVKKLSKDMEGNFHLTELGGVLDEESEKDERKDVSEDE
ncbi:MAG: exodeoxyribonuclease VII small subunit [Ignavibacteriae bacterium]|nr:exodeoxyribonuclease VII small subunit [Ignavibacteriota bacterium]